MNLKKILSSCLALMLAFGVTPAVLAQEETAEGAYDAELSSQGEASLMAIDNKTFGIYSFEFDTSKRTAVVTAIGANAGTVVIKDTVVNTIKSAEDTKYEEYKVVGIADGVGNALAKPTVIDLSGATNLTYIGDNCFSYCPLVTKVSFPTKSVITSIGNNAFYYCPKLETVTNGNKLELTSVGSSILGLTPYMSMQTDENVVLGNVLLRYNGSDTDVTVPDGVTAIADAYFGKPIVSVDLGEVTYIGNNAFYGCRDLESIELPATVTGIGDMAFSGCTALESVTYGNGLTSVGFCAFANCSALKSFKYTGSKTPALTNVGECAFWNCRKLYYLDTGVIKNVNVGSFWNCFGETPDEVGGVYYYKIPDTVKTIAEGGYGNLWFAYVAVPDSVEAIASTAFGATDGAIYVTGKGSLAEEFFTGSGYTSINYGDIDADGTIKANDIKRVAEYIAEDIMAKCAAGTTESERDVLNYDIGKGLIADIDGDGKITTTDLMKIFSSIKAEYEAAQE